MTEKRREKKKKKMEHSRPRAVKRLAVGKVQLRDVRVDQGASRIHNSVLFHHFA